MITARGLMHIYKKEMKTYLVSPVAYIVVGFFLIVATLWFFFAMSFFGRNQANMRIFFESLPVLFIIIIPLITMHLFSEEINIGSYEMLLTMPVSFIDIIIAKFLAALTLTVVCLFPTLSYAICISFLGNLDWGPVIGGYLGALLLGAAYCAIGLFVSSLTRHQLIAFLIGLAICGALSISRILMVYVFMFISVPLQYLDAYLHFQNIAKGIVDTRDIIYFISICFLALYGTKLVMEEKN